MAQADLELVPIVDDDGALIGVLTERALARRYIRESRETSTLRGRAHERVSAVVDVLEGELVAGEDRRCPGACGCTRWTPHPQRDLDGDVVVVGNRADAQRLAIELGAALLVLSNGSEPDRRRPGAGARSRAPR